MKILSLVIVMIMGLSTICSGLTNYLGGYSPGSGEDWLPASWANFSNQVAKLTSPGDELRIAGTITREAGSGTYWVSNATHGIKITGGWNSPGEGVPWTRKDLTDTNNFSVIDANQLGDILYIGGTNVLIEGIHFKAGRPQSAFGALGSVALVGANGSIIDYCRFSDCGSESGAGYGAALFIRGSTNVTVRRSSFYNNFGVTNTATASTCHLFVHKTLDNTAASHNIRITQCRFERTHPNSVAWFSVALCQEVWTPRGTNSVIFDNCLFYDNAKSIFCEYGSNVFINTTIRNSNLWFHDYGSHKTYFQNCIIDNCSYTWTDSGSSGAKLYFNNSCVTNLAWLGSQPFTNTAGQIQITVYTDACVDITTENPVRFVNTSQNNFRLMVDSPAVDLGSDTYLGWTYQGAILGLPVNQQTDLDGMGRRKRNRVDAGAYENQPPSGTMIFFR